MSLIELLRRFEEVYSTQKGLPWIGTVRPEQAFGRAIAELEAMQAEIELRWHQLRVFIEIIDSTEVTGFDPHVEQLLMEAADEARASLHGQEQ